VIESGAKKVYTLYGDHFFASHLRQRGVDAEHLHEYSEPSSPSIKRRKTRRRAESETLSLLELIEKVK
jgi:hypothetical protein